MHWKTTTLFQGHTYEKDELDRWLQTHNTSPMTGQTLNTKQYVINYNVKSMIDEYLRSETRPAATFTLHRGRPHRDDWKNLPQMKIIISLLGPTSVGKSCLTRNVDLSQPPSSPRSTVTLATDIAFFYLDVLLDDQYVVIVQLNDCPGNERYESVSTHHFRNCHGAVLMADTTDINTFDRLENYWYQSLRDKCTFEQVESVLACNKIDLLEQEHFTAEYRDEFFQKAHDFAARYQIPIFNISATRGDNIALMFHQLISNILNNTHLIQHLKDRAEVPSANKTKATRPSSTVVLSNPRRKKSTKKCACS